MPDSLEFAGLLCARLCHDLMNPVGALSNGLELLADEEDPQLRKRCLDQLEQSARVSADKLRFFRLAFGAGGGDGLVPVAEVRTLVEALAGNAERLTVNWAIAADALPRPAAKVLLNLALIGIEALVRGGTLEIGAELGIDSSEIVVRAAGSRIAFDPAIGRALDGSLAEEELSSRTAPAAMVRELATDPGGSIQFALSDEALVMGADLPVAGDRRG
jgi:histidine phosphotransferase ChpT